MVRVTQRYKYCIPTAAAMQGIHHASGTLPVACKKTLKASAHAALAAMVAVLPKRMPSGRA